MSMSMTRMIDMEHNDTEINVIILENIKQEREDLVDSYYDILKSCKLASEVKSALKMIVSECRELTLREVLVRDIQNKVKILEETKVKD